MQLTRAFWAGFRGPLTRYLKGCLQRGRCHRRLRYGTGRSTVNVHQPALIRDLTATGVLDLARVSLDRHATYIVSTFIAGASR